MDKSEHNKTTKRETIITFSLSYMNMMETLLFGRLTDNSDQETLKRNRIKLNYRHSSVIKLRNRIDELKSEYPFITDVCNLLTSELDAYLFNLSNRIQTQQRIITSDKFDGSQLVRM